MVDHSVHRYKGGGGVVAYVCHDWFAVAVQRPHCDGRIEWLMEWEEVGRRAGPVAAWRFDMCNDQSETSFISRYPIAAPGDDMQVACFSFLLVARSAIAPARD